MPPERFDWSDRRPPQASPSPGGLAPAGLAEVGGAAPTPGGTSAPPDLEVRTRRSVHQLTAGTTFRIGRDPKSDIVMTDSRVSWRHGELRVDGDGWIVEDLGSTNGTFHGLQRFDRIEIREECVVRLGNPDDGPVLRCVPQVAAAAPAPPVAPPADHPGTALSMPAAPSSAAAKPPIGEGPPAEDTVDAPVVAGAGPNDSEANVTDPSDSEGACPAEPDVPFDRQRLEAMFAEPHQGNIKRTAAQVVYQHGLFGERHRFAGR